MTDNKQLCKATTSSGEQCKITAGPSGYCYIHDPVKQAERRKQKRETWEKGQELREVLDIIKSTAHAAGWICYIKNQDEENWRYATVNFSRTVSYVEVAGFFDIVVNGEVKVLANKTSFYGHGIKLLHETIMTELRKLPWLESKKKENSGSSISETEKIKYLLQRFHIVARQLKRRYNDRETLIIRDEYDVQDLLHTLLLTLYDDVRPEENVPSYGGASSRIDFLLKKEEIVIEVKLASSSLRDKSIGEQLIIDIKRYQMHPNCKSLICFVYDPESVIKNPIALENDLSGKHDKIIVKVYVVPH
jgi:hypothetical protein